MLKKHLHKAIKDVIGTEKLLLLAPKNPDHGDYAVHKSAVPDHKLLTAGFKHELVASVEQVGDFINFSLSQSALWNEANRILEEKEQYGKNNLFEGKKIIVEFAHPNTHKLFHIGHLRNITTGQTVSRILENAGASVIRANYQGDVGLHIAKCLYGIQHAPELPSHDTPIQERIAFLGTSYAAGHKAYEEDEVAKQEIQAINKQIFEMDSTIKPLWEQTRAWSLEYFDLIYHRLHTKFDRLFFESEVAQTGFEIAQQALQKGILQESDGAVVFKGDEHGVHTRVFINSIGLPTYEAKELGLAQKEFSEFGEIDQCIHIVAGEQSSFFTTTFKVQELLDEKYKGKQKHFVYGFVDLKDGKMSSRAGNVVEGNWLLDQVKSHLQEKFPDSNAAETLAIAATKYSFLKLEAQKNFQFDINESISLQGNSGPYLLYTYARANSIVIKAGDVGATNITDTSNPNELVLLRTLIKFPEVTEAAAQKIAPHLIATYLFDVSQKFNKLYESTSIMKSNNEDKTRLLLLTKATMQVIKNGLNLLGIETLEKI